MVINPFDNGSNKGFLNHICSTFLRLLRRATLAAVQTPWQLFLGQIEHRLDAAAEVHQAKGQVVNIAGKHVRMKVFLKGEECNRWEVVKHYDGQNYEDRLEGSLLHGMHLVSAGPGLTKRPQDRYVAEHHEGERCEDHGREDLLKVLNIAYTFSRGIGQCDQPDYDDQDCPVLTVLELREGDGVDHGHVAVQTDAGKEERRTVFYAVEEAKDVPGAGGGGEEDDVGQLQGRDEAEEDV